mmetsp:Transcript_4915/g.17817  ORF Transcript_4915/g.17817 Transcript_4915/m.17817 type:complete len:100 (+) Transcript_4915:781-1080(+)
MSSVRSSQDVLEDYWLLQNLEFANGCNGMLCFAKLERNLFRIPPNEAGLSKRMFDSLGLLCLPGSTKTRCCLWWTGCRRGSFLDQPHLHETLLAGHTCR